MVAITGEQLLEIRRCMEDPVYWLAEYVWIFDSSSFQEFKLGDKIFPFQRDLFNDFYTTNARLIAALKGRQQGVSWLAVAYAVHQLLFRRASKTVVVSRRGDNGRAAKEIVQRAKFILSRLPAWMQPSRYLKFNETEIQTPSGVIQSYSLGDDTARGTNASTVIADECLFYSPRLARSFWAAVLPAVNNPSSRAKVILISTPKYSSSILCQLFMEAREGRRPNVRLVELPWQVFESRLYHPDTGEYDGGEEWKRRTIADLGDPRIFAVEYELSFVNLTGQAFFRPEDQAVRTALNRPADDAFGLGMTLREYCRANPMRAVLGVDVAEGHPEDKGSDSSAAMLWVADPQGVWWNFAHLVGKWKVDMLATVVVRMSEEWGGVQIVVEANGVGAGLTALLIERKIANLWRDPSTGAVGFKTSSGNRLQMLLELEQAIRGGEAMVGSSVMVQQMATFVHKVSRSGQARPEHEDGFHDDTILASAMALYASKHRRTARVSTTRPAGL